MTILKYLYTLKRHERLEEADKSTSFSMGAFN